jgi:hypothetical protein
MPMAKGIPTRKGAIVGFAVMLLAGQSFAGSRHPHPERNPVLTGGSRGFQVIPWTGPDVIRQHNDPSVRKAKLGRLSMLAPL